ncbi:MAG: transglutaminase-like cysteine peptidase [Pseudomonadota bacterium]
MPALKPFFVAIVLASALAWQGAAAGPFGASETRYTSLAAFEKWTGMWRRMAAQDAAPSSAASRWALCPPDRLCSQDDFDAMVARLAGADPALQMRELNLILNRAPYIIDPVNWGVPDYWATVREFLRKDGDCEDYVIAKYVALKRLGVPPGTMRIVVVDDLNLGVPHAVLAVAIDGQTWILDNQVDMVLPDSAIHHYRPIYSINEEAWWLHSLPGGPR